MVNILPSNSLEPTWLGYISTTKDAVILFEACLDGTLHQVPRRPHDRERSSLIKSSHVFIYEENASGIKRWTDGISWSPSRILGNFLVYRELAKPFPPGEKRLAPKRPKNGRIFKPGEPYPKQASSKEQPSSDITVRTDSTFDSRESERALIGSLIDSYGFKEGGLMKKTISMTWHGVNHHIVSYYNTQDVLGDTLRTPSEDFDLKHIRPRPELIRCQNFRAPLDDCDLSLQDSTSSVSSAYDYESTALMNLMDQHHQVSKLDLNAYRTGPYSIPEMQTGPQSYVPAIQATQVFSSTSSDLVQSFPLSQEACAPFGMPYHFAHSGQLSIPQNNPIQQRLDREVSFSPISLRPLSPRSTYRTNNTYPAVDALEQLALAPESRQ